VTVGRVRLLAVLLVLVAVEVGARIGFAALRARGDLLVEPAYSGRLSAAQREIIRTRILGDETAYTAYSAVLGWTIKPYGRSDLYHANAQGIRSDREYTAHPPAARVRIAAFGDSYTHGDEVADGETWARQLENLNPNLEVLNFGVGGFGTDQALLRYEHEGVAFHPHIALLGFRPENIYRVVSVFRPFYTPATGVPMAKPRFELRDGRLVLLPNPIPEREGYRALLDAERMELARLGEHDYFYQRSYRYRRGDGIAAVGLMRLFAHQAEIALARADRIEREGRFNRDAEAFQVLSAIFVRFRDLAQQSGSRPLALVLPDDDDIRQYQATKVRRYEPLIAFLRTEGIEYIDLMDVFAAHVADHEISTLFSGHYNALGNRTAARGIDDYLVGRGYATR